MSNFSLPGYESKHNMNYWERGEYIGVGVAASSFVNNRRFTNTFKIDEYINAVIYNKTPEISSDVIEGEDAKFEFIMLALRTTKGMSIKKFNAEFNADFEKDYAETLKKKSEYLIFDQDLLKIKDEYLYVQNDIILSFLKV